MIVSQYHLPGTPGDTVLVTENYPNYLRRLRNNSEKADDPGLGARLTSYYCASNVFAGTVFLRRCPGCEEGSLGPCTPAPQEMAFWPLSLLRLGAKLL